MKYYGKNLWAVCSLLATTAAVVSAQAEPSDHPNLRRGLQKDDKKAKDNKNKDNKNNKNKSSVLDAVQAIIDAQALQGNAASSTSLNSGTQFDVVAAQRPDDDSGDYLASTASFGTTGNTVATVSAAAASSGSKVPVRGSYSTYRANPAYAGAGAGGKTVTGGGSASATVSSVGPAAVRSESTQPEENTTSSSPVVASRPAAATSTTTATASSTSTRPVVSSSSSTTSTTTASSPPVRNYGIPCVPSANNKFTCCNNGLSDCSAEHDCCDAYRNICVTKAKLQGYQLRNLRCKADLLAKQQQQEAQEEEEAVEERPAVVNSSRPVEVSSATSAASSAAPADVVKTSSGAVQTTTYRPPPSSSSQASSSTTTTTYRAPQASSSSTSSSTTTTSGVTTYRAPDKFTGTTTYIAPPTSTTSSYNRNDAGSATNSREGQIITGHQIWYEHEGHPTIPSSESTFSNAPENMRDASGPQGGGSGGYYSGSTIQITSSNTGTASANSNMNSGVTTESANRVSVEDAPCNGSNTSPTAQSYGIVEAYQRWLDPQTPAVWGTCTTTRQCPPGSCCLGHTLGGACINLEDVCEEGERDCPYPNGITVKLCLCDEHSGSSSNGSKPEVVGYGQKGERPLGALDDYGK